MTIKGRELIIPAADDFHVHLRNDERTAPAVAALKTGGVGRALVMPNTVPAIETGTEALNYRENLMNHDPGVELFMTIKLSPRTTINHILDASTDGILAGKQYPDGVTTNSEHGVRDVKAMFPVYEAMQSVDMVLSLHGEVPGVFVLDAEQEFLQELLLIHQNFPKLRIVLEHITTASAVETISGLPDCVAATITDHHLAITLQDVVGSRIQPHHFCMPVAKRPTDRQALLEIVGKGHPSFFSGTDSAPHLREDKECDSGCAGVFTSLIHMPLLAHLLDEYGSLDRIQAFTSQFGADFYGLKYQKKEIQLIGKPMKVPDDHMGITPFFAGKILDFSLNT